jgi:CRP/FNR family transcriptional regulator, nitrogen fixation regulation protein
MEGKASLAQVMARGAQARGRFEPPIRDPLGTFDGSAATTRHRRGEEVYAPEDPAEHWYRLVSGMARTCAIKADGRRQIVDFLLPGDFFGLITRHAHRFAVEAVVDGTEVTRYPRRKIELLADFDPRIGRLIREAAFEAISRAHPRGDERWEKVGAFLIEGGAFACRGLGRGRPADVPL